MDVLQSSLSFLHRLSNLGIPGAWAFHIGSRLPLSNVRPAAAGGDLPTAHNSKLLEHSFSHAAALESYSKGDFDYYDENEEDTEYPLVEPGEALEGYSRVDVSFSSNADPGPVEGGTPSPDPNWATPLPHPAPGDWPSYWDPQTKQGAPVGEVEVLDFKDPVEPLDQMGIGTPAPPEPNGTLLTPGKEDLRNRNAQPYTDAGPVPFEPGVLVPPGEVLPNYPVSGHEPPLSGRRYVVGVDDHIDSDDQGKRIGKVGFCGVI